jgi:hypothetical protein
MAGRTLVIVVNAMQATSFVRSGTFYYHHKILRYFRSLERKDSLFNVCTCTCMYVVECPTPPSIIHVETNLEQRNVPGDRHNTSSCVAALYPIDNLGGGPRNSIDTFVTVCNCVHCMMHPPDM